MTKIEIQDSAEANQTPEQTQAPQSGEAKENETTETSAWNRIASYQPVTTAVETAKAYYSAAKENYPTAQYVGEKLEATVQGSIQYLAPKVEPVIQSEMYQKLATSVDHTVNAGLDVLELKVGQVKEGLEHRAEQLQQVKANLGEKYENAKTSTYTQIENADNYLKDSVVGRPLSVALSATERIVEGEPAERGPILQAVHLSQLVQEKALAKLKNLSIRAPDKAVAVQRALDLIKYASTSLENSLHAIGGKVQQGVKEGTNYIYTAPKEFTKETSEKLASTVQDATQALHTAIHTLSEQLPEPVVVRVEEVSQMLKDIKWKPESIDLPSFYDIANKGYEALSNLNGTLSPYITKGEEVPVHLLQTATAKVTEVKDNLLAFLSKHTTTEAEPSKDTPTQQTN